MPFQNIKWIWILTAMLALACGISPGLVSAKQMVETNVAVVNGTAISEEDFKRELARTRQRFVMMGRSLTESQTNALREEVLENLINTELLYQESQSLGITIEKAAVDRQVQGLKKRFPSDQAFNKALERSNLSEGEIRAKFTRDLTIQKLVQERFAKKVKVSEAESKTYYEGHAEEFVEPEQVRARHVLIKVPPAADDAKKAQARKEIEGIQERVKGGEDFAALAKKHSQDSSGPKGGDLGYFRRGQMVKPFEDAAFALQPGQVSGIVETRFGFHLIQVTDRKPRRRLSFEEVKEKLALFLTREKVKALLREHLQDLKGKAKVERHLENISK